MTLLQILIVLLAAVAAWFFWDSLKVREAANTAMRNACAAHGMLFLDDTVALVRLGLERDDDGRARLRRTYAFEYSDTGHNRRKGSITMVSGIVSALDI